MTIEAMMTEVRQLSRSVEALAALGAELRLRQEGREADARVRGLLRDSARLVAARWLDGLDVNQSAPVLALIDTVFRQALDLLENPARAPGWSYSDARALQTQGQLSRIVVRAIQAFASQRPELGTALQRPGLFLDIGTGVGWIAIEAARIWPALRVVGIDFWEPSLALARENLLHNNLTNRVELRQQRVEELEESGTVTTAWVPGPFIAREIADQALARLRRALASGGWLIFGLNPPAADPLDDALVSLRTVRNGGHPWKTAEVEERLRAHGFLEIETFTPEIPVRFVIARAPGGLVPSAPRQRFSEALALIAENRVRSSQ